MPLVLMKGLTARVFIRKLKGKYMDYEKLLKIATMARENAYAPYSKYRVGCALLAKSGKVYVGANVENKSFSATCCAERVALFKAVSEGEREFVMIAIVGGSDNLDKICSPCGVCRQAFDEFVDGDFKYILGTLDKYFIYTQNDLLPLSFNGKVVK